VDSLTAVASIPDAVERDLRVTALWNALRDAERIPFAEGDSAAFLWRGAASTVSVAGDHNGWNPSIHPLARVGLSNVWMRVVALPEAARVDYKLVLNGSTWILDPNNPHQQWGGLGPNSELRMPAWVFPAETVRDPDVPAGTLSPDLVIASDTLGYGVRYRVYTPAAYASLSDLPVIYVTDGQDYADDRLGAARIVVDNLIDDGRAAPAIVVFVDPRSVVDGQNQREDQYVQNPAFAHFVARELVPVIDAAYRTRADRDARIILGTSLGGVFSLYLGLLQPDVFGRLAAQSAALWVTERPEWWTGPSLFEMMADAPAAPFDVFLSTGTIRDGEADARRMRDILLARAAGLAYREVPEGHSWGNWRALIDEMLIALVPGPAVPAEPAAPERDLDIRAAPNPTNGTVEVEFTLPAPGPVAVECFDMQGRLVSQTAADTLAAGHHVRPLRLDAAGTYICRVSASGRQAATPVTVIR
jgi:enterochelin esterase family protein